MNDMPYVNATVQLYKGVDKTKTIIKSAVTDNEGRFKLKIKETGQYTLVIEAYREGLSGEKIKWSSTKKCNELRINAKETGWDSTCVEIFID